jgi:hypothetical protein
MSVSITGVRVNVIVGLKFTENKGKGVGVAVAPPVAIGVGLVAGTPYRLL